MGIRGLKTYLNTKSVGNNIKWEDYKNKTIGIDIMPFMYKARADDANVLDTIANFMLELLKNEIKIILVLDGKPPKEKKDIMKTRTEERREATDKIELITKEIDAGIVPDKELALATIKHLKATTPTVRNTDVSEIKKLCYCMGISYYQCSGEADYFLAYLSNNNIIHAVMSPDMDLLTRNVKNLLVPETNIPLLDNNWTVYNLDYILEKFQYTYEQFVAFCVLIGCDYSGKFVRVPPKFAFDAIKVHKTVTLSYEKIGGDKTHFDLIKKAYEMLKYEEKEPKDLLGFSSFERFSSNTIIKPEIETMDDLELDSLIKEHILYHIYDIPYC
jgi:flap endonuclease-1